MKHLTLAITLLLVMGLIAGVPLSIIDKSYVSFDSQLSSPAWVVNVRGDNSADYLVFGDKEQLATEIDGQAAKPAADFTLDMSVESEKCEYNLISSERNDIYQYQIDKIGSNIVYWRADDYKKECLDSPGGIVAWGKSGITVGIALDIYCLRETKVASVGAVEAGKINFRTDFSLKKEGVADPIVKSVGSLAQDTTEIAPSVTFTDGQKTIARIRWIGGTTYGEFCPSASDYVSMETSSGWTTIAEDKYTLYNEQYQTLRELKNKIKDSDSITSDERKDVERLVAAVNQRGTEAMAKKMITADGMTASIEGSKSVIELPRDHLVYAPDFQILLNSDWLGIVYQTSKPKITDAGFNSCSEESGKTNQIFVTVKNIGNNEGQFDITAACQSGLSISATASRINLKPGDSGTANIPFSLDLTADTKKSCTIVATDSNSDNEDRISITTTCQATKFCTIEGQKECFGEVEKMCSGGQWLDTSSDACSKKVCNRNDKCEASLGETFEICGGKLASDNDCATCNLNDRCDATETVYSCADDCGPVEPKIATWVLILGGIALAGLVFFGLSKIKPKGKKGKK